MSGMIRPELYPIHIHFLQQQYRGGGGQDERGEGKGEGKREGRGRERVWGREREGGGEERGRGEHGGEEGRKGNYCGYCANMIVGGGC